ncbi:hypothetical protein CRG98_016317 [Punica granatum]|uniref:DHHA1 domain-containing protein n=1 Tax=Punica granatum TaxID=22663 RepID=A0A2I0K6J7_PUNGR|nr:hypothetical protein CRG98_016317 [Punica granatum]
MVSSVVANWAVSAASTAVSSLKKAAVLYHYPCPDGAFAALAAHMYFSAFPSTPALFFPNTVYNPIKPQQLPLHEIDDLYLLDFVGPPGFVQEVSSQVNRVVVLDHHKTALETLGGDSDTAENVLKVIDMGRSGATIAHDYFKQKLAGNSARVKEFERMRRLFEYVEDADLWRWNLPNSKAFSSGLNDLNIEFDVGASPSLFHQLLSLDLDSVISQGMLSLSHKQKLIDEALLQSYEIALGGGVFGRCLAVDADSDLSQLRSELGKQLADKSQKMNLRSIGAIVYRVPEFQNDELLKISLRSEGDEDTTSISQKFGGGGHWNASSFMLSSKEFEQWRVS